MKLTKDQILRVAQFARIHLSDDEVESLIPDLNSILELISQLDEVDTENVEQIDQITGLKDVMEKDEIKPFLKTDELIKCSPMIKKERMIQVKKSI
jgi:aspartyl-tRNA(Asn)/glutamyl-tRNA(Gln) amidotransferase subunit C